MNLHVARLSVHGGGGVWKRAKCIQRYIRGVFCDVCSGRHIFLFILTIYLSQLLHFYFSIWYPFQAPWWWVAVIRLLELISLNSLCVAADDSQRQALFANWL
jgi:hypothetical protein